ncbi:hypothetical protein ACH5RR_018360 [Cinchona calisaya]|uniref:Uncharacterized protein n=1 Tax=Cinchona calisaya TaxID=153742 RepID=A0ABD2ZMW4_9GENT
MQPFPPHTNFFCSLKHVEKRLKLENPSSSSNLPPPPPPSPSPPATPLEKAIDTQIDSLGSTIFLYLAQTATPTTSSKLQESDPPEEFLSCSPYFPPTQKNPFQENNEQNQETSNEAFESSDLHDIELLIQLLGLSDENEVKRSACGFDFGYGEDDFFGKIVGVKGPKCAKELQRLEGWIKCLMNGGGEKKEPLRLGHLLLCKAAFLTSLEGSTDGFASFEFPSTIDDFLHSDPPID